MAYWKSISNFKGYYSISNTGNVRRDVGWKGRCKKGRILKPFFHRKGYAYVTLHRPGIRKDVTVHSLVAKAFIGKRPYKKQINHKDSVKNNNTVCNLEYVTALQNIRHSFKNGTHRIQYGSESPNAKLTEAQVLKIKKMYRSGIFQNKIAIKFKVCPSTINWIIKNNTWKHVK